MATKKTKKKSVKLEDKVYLELNGSINIVEVKDGVKSSTPLDGDIVLRALLVFLEQSIREALAKDSEIDKLVKKIKVKKKKPNATKKVK